jgi:hypothetical protein
MVASSDTRNAATLATRNTGHGERPRSLAATAVVDAIEVALMNLGGCAVRPGFM